MEYLRPNTPFFSFFHKNYCTPPKCGKLSEYNDSAHTEVEGPSSRCMNASDEYDRCGMTKDNFILPARPVGGLPISQDWSDRIKLVRNSTVMLGSNLVAESVISIVTLRYRCINNSSDPVVTVSFIAGCVWGFCVFIILFYFFSFFSQ